MINKVICHIIKTHETAQAGTLSNKQTSGEIRRVGQHPWKEGMVYDFSD